MGHSAGADKLRGYNPCGAGLEQLFSMLLLGCPPQNEDIGAQTLGCQRDK